MARIKVWRLISQRLDNKINAKTFVCIIAVGKETFVADANELLIFFWNSINSPVDYWLRFINIYCNDLTIFE